jgi:hypothetical protein
LAQRNYGVESLAKLENGDLFLAKLKRRLLLGLHLRQAFHLANLTQSRFE